MAAKVKYVPELEEEIKTYFAGKEEYLKTAKGKYLLIKGTRVLGVFDSDRDALREGYKKFGGEPFLVKQVVEVEPELTYTAHILGGDVA